MLGLAADMSVDEFFTRHWQKQQLFAAGSVPDDLPALSGEELAWLATLDDVESRLIFTQRGDQEIPYRLENGPFPADLLANLPPADWTLLVQDVEKHLPELQAWISAVAFVPDWRVDDLMVSFAAPGGGVGPHRDNYDVFLCQMTGTRQWRLAAAAAGIAARHSGQLSLLQDFADPQPVIARPGDVLYLPPGVPHWGTAVDACMTWSIGLRAPTSAELHLTWERELPAVRSPFVGDESFFQDPDRRAAARRGEIAAPDIACCRNLLRLGAAASDAQLAIALGCTVTDPKAWLSPEAPDADEIAAMSGGQHARLTVHGMARLAWHRQDDQCLLFLNGIYRQAPPDELNIFAEVCEKRELMPDATEKWPALCRWMIEYGAFDPSGGPLENS